MEPASKIESIKIQGFRSLADVELADLPNAAVLIGPNGSGKSNIFLFLEMLQQMLRYRRLAQFVARHGGADDQLFGGSARTPEIFTSINLNNGNDHHVYSVTLQFAQTNMFVCSGEQLVSNRDDFAMQMRNLVRPGGGNESGLMSMKHDEIEDEFVGSVTSNPYLDSFFRSRSAFRDLFGELAFHQFHNTDFNSSIKKSCDITDNVRIRHDGSNLAAVLYRLEQEDPKRYDYICGHIQRILPTFDRFDLEESYGKVMLRWKARDSDKTMGAHLTSDGSLRAFCLVTLLNLPEEMLPSVILLDEPELGLHPSAVGLIGAMIRVMSQQRQVLVATQSPLLVDEFTPDEIFVTELKKGQTVITRQDEEYLSVWLEEYSTGELWQKNVMGGHP